MAAQQRPPTGASGIVNSSGPSAPPGFFRRPSTARILPFAAYMVFIAIADVLSRLGLSEDDLRWLYPLKIVAVVALLLAYRRMYAELFAGGLGIRATLASIATGIVVLVLWVNLDADWMQVGSAAGFDPTADSGQIDWLLVVLRIMGAALVVPIMEELFWRSFLMRYLEQHDFLRVAPAAVGWRAIGITVLLFGFEHNLWFAGVVAGICYSILYVRTGNLWAPILAHAVTNGLLGVWVVNTASWAYW